MNPTVEEQCLSEASELMSDLFFSFFFFLFTHYCMQCVPRCVNFCYLKKNCKCYQIKVVYYLYCVYALVGGVISIRDPYICAVSRVCANESHAVFHGPVVCAVKT